MGKCCLSVGNFFRLLAIFEHYQKESCFFLGMASLTEWAGVTLWLWHTFNLPASPLSAVTLSHLSHCSVTLSDNLSHLGPRGWGTFVPGPASLLPSIMRPAMYRGARGGEGGEQNKPAQFSRIYGQRWKEPDTALYGHIWNNKISIAPRSSVQPVFKKNLEDLVELLHFYERPVTRQPGWWKESPSPY